MMKRELSDYLEATVIEALKRAIERGQFHGIPFKHAMEFILTNGIMPKTGLPTEAFIELEKWIRAQGEEKSLTYSATELKNKTGEILEKVMTGHSVRLHRHGRVIAEIKRVEG